MEGKKGRKPFQSSKWQSAVISWPDAASCSEVQAANSSTSDLKPVKWDFIGKPLMNLSHSKRGSNLRVPWKLRFLKALILLTALLNSTLAYWIVLAISLCLFMEAALWGCLERLSDYKYNLSLSNFFLFCSCFIFILRLWLMKTVLVESVDR